MSLNNVFLRPITKNDVSRIKLWLKDDDICNSWFGRYSYGDPAHLGYHPEEIEQASDEEWNHTFNNPEHRILSIYTENGTHIGESHMFVEESLGDGHASILIGRKDMWHQGYGTRSMIELLELSFNEWNLYRVWVDVPEYNTAAMKMCRGLGFVHEGTLRKSRPHEGSRFDSVVMGILESEYKAISIHEGTSHKV